MLLAVGERFYKLNSTGHNIEILISLVAIEKNGFMGAYVLASANFRKLQQRLIV
jgi:hypothetical protein